MTKAYAAYLAALSQALRSGMTQRSRWLKGVGLRPEDYSIQSTLRPSGKSINSKALRHHGEAS